MSIVRNDSRTEVDVRTLAISTSLLSRSDGSAQFSFGDLKALGAVTGPAEVRLKDEKPTEATIEVNLVPVGGLPGPPTKSLAHSIKSFFSHLILLKKYPRSLIQINLQTLSKPSNRWTETFNTSSPEQTVVSRFDETQSVTEKAALINAASLALLDSGVYMKGCGFAIGVAIVPPSVVHSIHPDQSIQSDQIILDPNPIEESCAKSLHLIGFHFGHQFNMLTSNPEASPGKVALCESHGGFDYEELQMVLKYASLAAQQIFVFARRSCESKYSPVTSEVQSNLAPSLNADQQCSSNSNPNAKEEKWKRKKNKKSQMIPHRCW